MQEIILILVLGPMVGWISSRIGFPAAATQVLLGMLIGPPLIGWVTPGETLSMLGNLGVVLLLGMAGMHLGLGRLVESGWTGLWVAILGILFSFLGGYGFATWWGSPGAEALYVGTALTATSIGVSVQVLTQFGLLQATVGRVVVAAAVADDILALYLLAVAHGILSRGVAASRVIVSLLVAFIGLAVIFWVSRALARTASVRLRSAHSMMCAAGSAALMILFALVSSLMGMSIVVGGFFAGLGLGEGLGEQVRRRLFRQLDPLVLLLVPFFFVLIGTRAEFKVLADMGMLTLLLSLLAAAFAGKILGGILGAVGTGPLLGRVLIGIGMAPRGEVVLVISGLGFEQGHLSHHMFVALVLTTITTAVLAPLLMMPLARTHKGAVRDDGGGGRRTPGE